jgi:hypothetical protein
MMSYLLTCVGIGVIATLVMTFFLWTVTYLKLCNVNMVKAIGSWFTLKEETALLPGMIAHLSAGIVFCFVYVFAFSILPNPEDETFIYAILGAGMGFVHGIVVALALVVLVAEHHPLPKFQKAGMKVAAYHFMAHILYGLTIGSLYIWILDAKTLTLQ